MRTYKVAVLVGSLRKASYTRALAEALIRLSPQGFDYDLVEIGGLPLYNQDLEDADAPPEAWSAFRDEVRAADAVLFATPEYNRSVPGVLKNAIDVGSRPPGHSVWNGKPAAVISDTPGAMGGFGANHHLRQSLVFLNMPVLQQPEAYVGHVADLLTEDGGIAPAARDFLQGFMTAFTDWITLVAPRPAA